VGEKELEREEERRHQPFSH